MYVLSRKGGKMSGIQRMKALTGGHMTTSAVLAQLGLTGAVGSGSTPGATVARTPGEQPLESMPSLA